MKVKILAFFTLISICAHSQDCKFDKDYIDKDTHVHKYEKKIKIHSYYSTYTTNIVITICKYDSNYFFHLNLDQNNDFTSVRPEDTLIFKLDNGTIITAHPDTVYSSNLDRPTQHSLFDGTYHFDSQNDISKFYSAQVKSFRLYCNYHYRDFILKEKHQKQFLKAFDCLK